MARAPPPKDTLQAALRRAVQRTAGVQVPEIPERVRFELRRKVTHVLAAILAVPVLLLLPLVVAIGIAVVGVFVIFMTWAIERRRIPREFAGPLHDELALVLEKTRRPHEDFPWSPVLYTASLVIIALAHELLGMSWSIAFAAYAILGLGDAASALVGVAYGRRRLPWNAKKSVEGTTAGFVAGFLAGLVMASTPFAFAGLAVPPLFLVVVLVGALVGALAETVPGVEDNFVVPLSSAAAMFLLAGALAVPLP